MADDIKELYCKEGLTVSQISKELGLSIRPIKKIINYYGFIKKEKVIMDSVKYNTYTKPFTSDRNKEIVSLVTVEGKTYSEVGHMYGVTKQRIKQIVLKLVEGYSKWVYNRDVYVNMVQEIKGDIEHGLSYMDIIGKYDLDNKLIARLRYYGLGNIFSECLNNRNEIICDLYLNDFTAKEVANIFDMKERTIYDITSKYDKKKFPMIKDRRVGGSYLSSVALKFIIDSREKGVQYKDIARMLNDMGERTTTGLEFNVFRVFAYYNRYKDKL